MTIYIDIDGTICTWMENGDYALAEPFPDAIAKINQYYADGHEIVIWTARGSKTGGWRSGTEDQLARWGVKYHELKFGKPVWDVYICDRSVNAMDWRKLP